VAAARFDVTVMLLDDGFQHLELMRDVDLLVVSPKDLEEQLLPSGFLRESLEASAAADALIVPGSPEDATLVAGVLEGVGRASRSRPGATAVRVFSAVSRYEPFRPVNGDAAGSIAPGASALAVTGIARPQRFFDALGACDVRVVSEMAFADHHWFNARDVSRIEQAAHDKGAGVVVTTEKDAVRLSGMTLSMPWVTLPQHVSLTPEAEFTAWMQRRLAMAREQLAASPGGGNA
jgi:tetraacyldisaccharide 4'-kinase